LGNGFSNLMIAKYLASTKNTEWVGVVEGDDSLFWSGESFTTSDYLRLGFEVKMKVHSDLLLTSFCGMYMSSDRASMCDPVKTLVNFGWTHSPLMRSGDGVLKRLLRAKGLSLLYEHPACPIVSALAKRVVSVTSQVTPLFESSYWERQRERGIHSVAIESLMAREVTPASRLDFAATFRVSVELQLELENYFSVMDPFACMDHYSLRWLETMFGLKDYAKYDRCYVSKFPDGMWQ
jgi:hypothetical protein